ncbi:MAG: preprotein translocase subunit SecG [Patescibacteria group bacterium]|nr:preprotein translocase subunit SecG [Patescibacteria group bacterium]
MTWINWVEIVVAFLLVISILLQQRSTSLGGAFGGESAVYHTRRGIEKILFWLTIIFGLVFVTLALINVIY